MQAILANRVGGLVEWIIICSKSLKESKRMHTVHNNDVFGIPVWNVWSIMTIWYCYLEASLQALGLVSYHDSYLLYLIQQLSTVILIWSSIQNSFSCIRVRNSCRHYFFNFFIKLEGHSHNNHVSVLQYKYHPFCVFTLSLYYYERFTGSLS